MKHDHTCLKRETGRFSNKSNTADGKSGNGSQIGNDNGKYNLSNTTEMFNKLDVQGKKKI